MASSSTTPDLNVGQRVVLNKANRFGTVKFVGETKFDAGLWFGVELDDKVGKNNGTVQDVEYFNCPAGHGIFVKRKNLLTLEEAEESGPLPAATSRKSTSEARKSASESSKAEAKTPSVGIPASPKSPAKAAIPSSPKKSPASVEGGTEPAPKAASKSQQTLDLLRKNVPELRRRIAVQTKELEKERLQLQEAEKKLSTGQASQSTDPEVAKAAAELREVKAAVDKLRAQLQTWESQNARLETEVKKLQQKAPSSEETSSAGSEDLQSLKQELQKIELETEIEKQRFLELQLDLEELQLLQEEEKVHMAATNNKSQKKSIFSPNSKMVSEYEAALKILSITSDKDKTKLRERAEGLEKESEKVFGLKRQTEELTKKRQDLQASITNMEREVAELSTLSQSGDQLQDAQASVTHELRKQLELCDARVERFELLVSKMHKEKIDVELSISVDSARASELSAQLQELTADKENAEVPGNAANSSGESLSKHSRIVSAALRQQLAALAASAASCRAEAFVAWVPEAWKPGSEKTGTVDRDALGKVAESADVISMVESCLCRAEALTSHICTPCLTSLPRGSDQMAKWLCALCLVSGSCAAAAATALGKLRALPADSEQSLKSGPTEVIITEKEGNLGLSVKWVPPAKTLPVQRVAPGSLAEKHEIKPNSLLIAVQGKTTEKMSLDVFETVMKQRPLHLLLRPPQGAAKTSTVNLNLDMSACVKAQGSLDELLKSCRKGPPPPQPDALQTLGTLEQQFTALQRCAPEDKEPQHANRCVTALTLRRIEAVYRFGINVAPAENAEEPAAQAREDLARRLSETAARLQIADGAKELSVCSGDAHGPEERGLHLETLQDLLTKLEPLEGALRKLTSTSEILAVLDESVSDVGHGLDTINHTWPANRKRESTTTFFSSLAPGWTGCAAIVQREIDQVFDVQRQVADIRASLAEQKRAEELAQQRLEDARKRQAELQQDVDKLRQRCDECSALDQEAETLHAKAKESTSIQAELEQRLDAARTGREEQEKSCRGTAAKLAALERDLEERRKRPQQGLEGRATPQELATLKQRSTKGAWDLYALQVESVLNLDPLPPLANLATARSPASKTLDYCVSGYADVRRDLLLEWACPRLTKLAPCTEGSQNNRPKPLLAPVEVQVGRMQQLQIQLSQLRTATTALIENAALQPKPSQPKIADAKAAVQVKLDLKCPHWAVMPTKIDSPLAVTFEELHRLHAVVI